jgi:hypothetical protein
LTRQEPSRIVVAVARALLAVAEPVAARIPLGMGEQQARMFEDPRWERLGLRHARVLVDWDALDYKRQRVALDEWMARARATGTRARARGSGACTSTTGSPHGSRRRGIPA